MEFDEAVHTLKTRSSCLAYASCECNIEIYNIMKKRKQHGNNWVISSRGETAIISVSQFYPTADLYFIYGAHHDA